MLKTNEYFDGKVKSIAFQTETLPATVGVMVAGEASTQTFNAGDSFSVEANSAFDVKVDVETAYLCLYG